MFLIYWPYLALVLSLALCLVLVVVSLAGRLCRARMEPLPERDLSTYFTDSMENNILPYPTDEELLDAASAPPMMSDVEMQALPPSAGTFEAGLPYSLDQSMSPEGRRDFEV
ncbi:hypothetical protein TCAL_01518 [Tigriopus californicus]|uniref:Uncharacterized protein n=1 Tax=Tigriopus californicus TaxID=6832 RepID=A0A553P6X1_TIGCA|nr:hypothetical protein TCAL_01518 [Tigriopus californicus]|eukprot:TCALIF_01519-PA protein Name:"Protein of unknown function" AED:1.00 eAED:1.00 QI:0/0/0/0.5/1/1/2/0/111